MKRLLGLLVLMALGCAKTHPADAALITGGDSNRGRLAMRERGCGSCHQIPGVPGARGRVGPPLEGFAYREYIAGELRHALHLPDEIVVVPEASLAHQAPECSGRRPIVACPTCISRALDSLRQGWQVQVVDAIEGA